MNLRAALRQARIQYRTKETNSAEILLCCPFCVSRHESPDTRFRCAVNVIKNAGNCLNCNWAVNEGAIEAVIEALKLDSGREIRSWLLDEPEKVENQPGQKVEHGPPEGFFVLGAFHIDELPDEDPATRAIRYLQKRGCTWNQIVDQRIGMCLRERYAHRVVFPILYPIWNDTTQKVDKFVWDGFVARALGAQEPRYLNSAGPKPLYVAGRFENRSKIPTTTIVLSEGVIKAHAIYNSFDHLSWVSAAQLGHSLSDRQRGEISSAKAVIMFPDPDPIGLSGALKIARELSAQNEVLFPQSLPEKQADEYSINDLRKFFDSLEAFTPFTELKIERRIAEMRWR
jgi:hypothetical protein